MNNKERKVVGKLVADAKKAGYLLGIRQDGYVDTPHPNSFEFVMGELGQGKEDELFFFEQDKTYAGSVMLTYGTDSVITDYTLYLVGVVAGAEALANQLETVPCYS